jgi:pantoate--beta-alanine ligase
VKTIATVAELSELVDAWRQAGERVALVPTMGNLHAGHMSLVELAAKNAERVIVSVFVNPTQFGPNEDYSEYPRTPETDADQLSRAGVDVLFMPTVEEMYPGGLEGSTEVRVVEISDILCGASRPGHFAGVTSVVCRLFNMTTPDVAVFGQKDYQQLVILRKMVSDLHLPVKVLAGATERAENGLALSSRNNFLSDADKEQAAIIFSSLSAAGDKLQAGGSDLSAVENAGRQALQAAGLEPEYFTVRRADDLALPDAHDAELVVLSAARLQGVRLIDNMRVTRKL